MATAADTLAHGWRLLQAGQHKQAEQVYRQVVQAQPEQAALWRLLGAACQGQGKLNEAVTAFQEALRLRPDGSEEHNNLGVVLAAQAKLDEAVTHFREAVRLGPDSADAHNNLAAALAKQGRLDEAVAIYEEALRLKPASAVTRHNLGITLVKLGRFDDALAQFDEALRLSPEYAEAHHYRAIVRLTHGDYERGWPEYEWRWKCKDFPARSFSQPLWDGSPLAGRTILLHSEQGLGDTLQFVRYAGLVKGRGGTVILEAPPALHPLLHTCPGIDRLAVRGAALPPFDVHAPLLSLPRLFGTTPQTVPAEVPYLFARADLVEQWRRELAPVGGFRIGVVWQGSPRYLRDRYRSIPLESFGPLAALPGVRLISLQKGPGTEQIAQAAGRVTLHDLGSRLDESAGAFMDTAAVMKNLDLVVTCDTAAGHLAGALGVPAFVALPYATDWRWMLGRDDSPWYPTVRLFRQTAAGDWDGVFARIAEAVRPRLAAAGRNGPMLVEVAPGELLDKISILEIKGARIKDPAKLANVRRELEVLAAVRDRSVPPGPELDALAAELKTVNEALWQVEDDLRLCERDGYFGAYFVTLARSVYKHNDRRAALKRRINELLGSALVEEKSYSAADGG